MSDLNAAKRERLRRMESLVERVDKKGTAALSTDEVKDFCKLYRQVTIELSQARANGADPQLVHYLNRLATRGHSAVYAAQSRGVKPFRRFLLGGFPAVLRRRWKAVAVAAAIFLASGLASFLAVREEPELAYSLFDEKVIENENDRLENYVGEYRGNFTFESKHNAVMAAYIIGNNVKVAALAFGCGALVCIPAILLLTQNGRMLGALSGVIWNHGYAADFYSLILTHGILELSAICISAGGGLLMGWAIIHPGPLTRRAALRESARDAFGLLAGAAAMLVVAGIIEAYITPHYEKPTRWSVAAGSGVLMVAYFALAGRGSKVPTAA